MRKYSIYIILLLCVFTSTRTYASHKNVIVSRVEIEYTYVIGYGVRVCKAVYMKRKDNYILQNAHSNAQDIPHKIPASKIHFFASKLKSLMTDTCAYYTFSDKEIRDYRNLIANLSRGKSFSEFYLLNDVDSEKYTNIINRPVIQKLTCDSISRLMHTENRLFYANVPTIRITLYQSNKTKTCIYPLGKYCGSPWVVNDGDNIYYIKFEETNKWIKELGFNYYFYFGSREYMLLHIASILAGEQT